MQASTLPKSLICSFFKSHVNFSKLFICLVSLSSINNGSNFAFRNFDRAVHSKMKWLSFSIFSCMQTLHRCVWHLGSLSLPVSTSSGRMPQRRWATRLLSFLGNTPQEKPGYSVLQYLRCWIILVSPHRSRIVGHWENIWVIWGIVCLIPHVTHLFKYIDNSPKWPTSGQGEGLYSPVIIQEFMFPTPQVFIFRNVRPPWDTEIDLCCREVLCKAIWIDVGLYQMLCLC